MKVKIVLLPRADKNGQHPIYIRVTPKGQKPTYKALALTTSKEDWNPVSCTVKDTAKDFKDINTVLNNLERKCSRYLEDLKNEGKAEPTTNDLLQHLFALNENKSFYKYADEYIANLKNVHTRLTYASPLGHMKKYQKGDLKFSQITLSYLAKLSTWLIGETSEVTAHSYLAMIRAIYRDAVKKGIIRRENDAFFYFTSKKGKSKKKEYLTDDEMLTYQNHYFEPNTGLADVRNAYIFSVNVFGLRIKDLCLLKKKNVQSVTIKVDGEDIIQYRLIYTTSKTQMLRDILLKGQALEIYNLYKDTDSEYIFPFMDRAKKRVNPTNPTNNMIFIYTMNLARKYFNNNLLKGVQLCEINKHITSHSARNKVANSRRDIARYALGHSDSKTTEIYFDDSNDRMLDDVVIYPQK